MPDLAGLVVAVTRPGERGRALCRAIDAAGGHSLHFPALEIVPPADPGPARERLGRAGEHDWLVFVSPTAVERAVALRPQPPADARVAAVGRGTARALRAAGWPVHVEPESGADSESLLARPELAGLAGRSVLLVKGEGGRALLRRTLEARGARLAVADVYRRRCPAGDLGPLVAAEAQVLVVTSSEALGNLLAMAGRDREWLLGRELVVIHPRIAERARELGFARVHPAAGAEPAQLLAVLAGLGRGDCARLRD